jgi:hypothetical protein
MLFLQSPEINPKSKICDMMKVIKIDTLAILFAAFAVFTGCKDKSDDEVSPFVGNFTIKNAELAEAIDLTTNAGPISIPVGTNITTQIQDALLSSLDCVSAGYAYVELRKNFSIFMSCAGENEFNAGTWAEVNDSTLTLNMNSTAIPSSPSGFVLTVNNIEENESGMRGKTSVPLPKEMIQAMISAAYPGVTLDPSTPAVLMAVFYIDFEKK